jgi:hypothetical protein
VLKCCSAFELNTASALARHMCQPHHISNLFNNVQRNVKEKLQVILGDLKKVSSTEKIMGVFLHQYMVACTVFWC